MEVRRLTSPVGQRPGFQSHDNAAHSRRYDEEHMDSRRQSPPVSQPHKNYMSVTTCVIIVLCMIFIGQSIFIGFVLTSKDDSVGKLLLQSRSWSDSSGQGEAIQAFGSVDDNSATVSSSSSSSSSNGDRDSRLNPSKISKQQFLGNLGSILNVVSKQRKFNTETRVAVIAPYVGSTLPGWFDSFLFSVRSSSAMFDWFVFITDDVVRPVPPNVRLIYISREDFWERMVRIGIAFPEEIKELGGLAFIMNYVIEKFKFSVVEFKPLWGSLFQDYLIGYSHWAFADIDMYLGRMDHLVNHLLLDEFDIYTISFGDSYRFYLRGQLTIHKNNERVNEIWRECEHLSQFGNRLLNFYKAVKDRPDRQERWRWPFQSAEGCYSKVAIDNDEISVYVAAGQMSDAYGGKVKEKEALVIGDSVLRCYEHPLNAESDREDLLELYNDVGDMDPMVHKTSLQEGLEYMRIGLVPIERSSINCEYWIEKKYQVCLEHIKGDVDIISSKGAISYYPEKKFYLMKNNKCREGLVMHFQGWKKTYYTYTTRTPSLDTHVMLISDFGFIPLRITELGLPTFAQLPYVDNGTTAYLGKLSFEDTTKEKINAAEKQQPHTYIKANKGKGFATSYCLEYYEDLRKCKSYLHKEHIRVVWSQPDVAPRGNMRASTNTKVLSNSLPETTLVVSCLREDVESGHLDKLLESWIYGPKIIVAGKRRDQYGVRDPYKTMSILRYNSVVIEVDLYSGFWGHDVLPTGTLLNIGLDVTRTDLVCVCPNCGRIELLFGVESSSSKLFPENGMSSIVRQLNAHTESDSDKEIHAVLKTTNPTAIVIPIYKNALNSIKSNVRDPRQKSLYTGCGKKHTQYQKSFTDLLNSGKNEGSSDMQTLEYQDKDGTTRSVQVKFKDTLKDSLGLREEVVIDRGTPPLPMILNQTQSSHGKDFFRFPEELNGLGCFGGSYLQILSGSGYALHWPNSYRNEHDEKAENTYFSVIASTSSDEKIESCSCRVSRTQYESAVYFLKTLMRYFWRVREFRKNGVSDVYAEQKFGVPFENDQTEMRKREQTLEVDHENAF